MNRATAILCGFMLFAGGLAAAAGTAAAEDALAELQAARVNVRVLPVSVDHLLPPEEAVLLGPQALPGRTPLDVGAHPGPGEEVVPGDEVEAAVDPLPSWNETATKAKITFMITPAEMIAMRLGTLWAR